MTGAIALQGAALVAAALLRHRGPRAGLPVVGLLVAVALFGVGPWRLPTLEGAIAISAALPLVLVLLLWPVWPPMVTEAAATVAFFGLPVLGWTVFVLRGRTVGEIALAVAVLAAVLGAAAAGGAQASGEAGWRRPVFWILAVASAAAVGAGLSWWASGAAPRHRPWVAVAAALLTFLAFLPAYAVEGRRVLRELGEESKLGLLPAGDVESLARPWQRAHEPRFGRADERRTYVKSALLLAVALQQQRRRSGDAVRLRQLEVLTFRTRVRRTLEARAARATLTDELTLPA